VPQWTEDKAINSRTVLGIRGHQLAPTQLVEKMTRIKMCAVLP